MKPVNFESANTVFGKPADMTDEQCTSIDAEIGIDNQGFNYIATAWQPSESDLKTIAAGKPIFVKVIGTGLPPMSIFTIDDNGQVNE